MAEGADDEGGVVDGGPGLTYMPFVVMEDLLDKLKLLNYEEVRGPDASQSQFKKDTRLRYICTH